MMSPHFVVVRVVAATTTVRSKLISDRVVAVIESLVIESGSRNATLQLVIPVTCISELLFLIFFWFQCGADATAGTAAHFHPTLGAPEVGTATATAPRTAKERRHGRSRDLVGLFAESKSGFSWRPGCRRPW